MGTVTRRWWKAAAAAVVLGGGGYAALAQTPAGPTWVRSSSPLLPPTSLVAPPGKSDVIPASATMPAAQPPLPPLPATPTAPPAKAEPPVEFKAPAVPKLPALPPPPGAAVPAVPVAPALPPMPVVAPPAPPAKSVLPAQPAAPVKTDSPLRGPNGGNSVNSEAAWKARAVAPPPREVTRSEPPVAAIPVARQVDRPKAPEAPVAPSERDVFPIPRPTPPAPVSGPAAPPMPVMPPVPPAPKTTTVATPPGADPMTFKSTAAAAVLGGALALPAGKAAAQNTDPPAKDAAAKTADDKLAAIQKDLHRLTELLDGKRDDTGARLPSDPGLVQQVRELKDKVADLEKQMTALRTTSLRPPAGGTPPAATPSIPGVPNPMPAPGANPNPAPATAAHQGTVRVVNEYPVEITMVVNGRSHRVAQGATLDIPIPAGDFSYQLLSGSTALAPTRSTIRQNEVVTLRIK